MPVNTLVTGAFWVTTNSLGVYVAKSKNSPSTLMLYKECGHVSTKHTLVSPCECQADKKNDL